MLHGFALHFVQPRGVHPKAFDWQAAYPEVFAQGGVPNVAPVACWAGESQESASGGHP